MKLVKSLLLGSAAGLAAVSGAQAADLPMRKAAPAAAVDYVRVCSTYGSGFFVIPGTEGCLRVGGRVRADAIYVEPFTRADNAIEFVARGRIQLDHRQATAYGLLRSFVRYDFNLSGGGTTSPNLSQAFIQFGGLTAGRVTSFFSNADLPTAHMGTLRFDDAPENNLFGYTFDFGGGLSASIALEDNRGRRTSGFSNALLGGVTEGGVGIVDGVLVQAPYALVYGGQTMPDIVANIKTKGSWGSAQLSGAVHQVRDVGIAAGRFNQTVNPIVPLSAFADTEYGFAVMGSLGINLPALGAGDAAYIAATYSTGAAAYSGFGSTVGFGSQFSSGIVDAFVNPFNGDLELTDVWTVAGGFTHNWSPQLRSSIFGSYARVEFGGNSSAVLANGQTVGLADFDEFRIGANTFFTPVSGLDIGVEVLYAEADYRGRVSVPTVSALGRRSNLDGDVGAIEGRVRVQRNF